MADSTPGLEFQELSNEKDMWHVEGNIGQSSGAATLDIDGDKADTHTFTKFPDSAVDVEEEDDTDTTELINRKKNAVWSFAYYQEFFDVDTTTVLNRIKGSMLPLPSKSFSRSYIGGRPDIYGPFWISATLVLVISVCGNITTAISRWNDPNYNYKPQFELLPVAAILVYSYTFIIPLFIKAVFWWRKTSTVLSVSHIICTYGYSLFIFIPTSILYLVPFDAFDWIVAAIAIACSGAVITITLWPALRDDNKQLGMAVLAVVFFLHALMAVGLKLYFFSSISQNTPSNLSNSTITTVKP